MTFSPRISNLAAILLTFLGSTRAAYSWTRLEVLEGNHTYAQAAAQCSSRGAALAQPRDATQFAALQTALADAGRSTNCAWMGAYMNGRTMTWLSGDVVPSSPELWAPGNPSGDGRCLELVYFWSIGRLGLNDLSCSANRPAVCAFQGRACLTWCYVGSWPDKRWFEKEGDCYTNKCRGVNHGRWGQKNDRPWCYISKSWPHEQVKGRTWDDCGVPYCRDTLCERTTSGTRCQRWRDFGYTYEEGNRCTRANHNEPWCYYDFPDGWATCNETCGVNTCWERSRLNVDKRNYRTIYNGTANTGVSGRRCINYRDAASGKGYLDRGFIDHADYVSNFCRVIDFDKPWCYVNSHVWELCDVDVCNAGDRVAAQVCVGTLGHSGGGVGHGPPWGAGTDGKVYIRLRGRNTWSNTVYLHDPTNPNKDPFEIGKCDCFMVNLTDVGQITKIALRKCEKDKWKPEWVHVQYLNSEWRYRASFDHFFDCETVESTQVYRAANSLAGKSAAALKSCSMNADQFKAASRLGS